MFVFSFFLNFFTCFQYFLNLMPVLVDKIDLNSDILTGLLEEFEFIFFIIFIFFHIIFLIIFLIFQFFLQDFFSHFSIFSIFYIVDRKIESANVSTE